MYDAAACTALCQANCGVDAWAFNDSTDTCATGCGNSGFPTYTPTNTNTPTDTPTLTPTDTPTQTPTDTPTDTPTNTPTQTPTETPTNTPTQTPTNTNTPTETPTETPTNTPTQTPTETPTNTPTQTPTETPTNTPTQTPTETPTNTPTPTPTPASPQIIGGAEPGSTVITGVGQPNELGPCIYICENGPNNTFEDCVPAATSPYFPTGDDVSLGTPAPTDASGNWTVTLTTPLESGDVICAFDACDPNAPVDYGRGNCVLVIEPAPAPAMSPAAMAMAVALLSLVGLGGMIRLRWNND